MYIDANTLNLLFVARQIPHKLSRKGAVTAMAIIVPNISLNLNQPRADAITKACRLLGLSTSDVQRAYISKVSVDARKRAHIRLVYSVGVAVENEHRYSARAKACGAVIKQYREPEFFCAQEPMRHPPVVAGFGPAGMFCALVLARHGYRPIVVERGSDVDRRIDAVNAFWQGKGLNTSSNVQFGEGGAGTFSDGKLTTRIGDARCDYIMRELHAHGAPDDILEKAKPHIGTDHLRGVVKSIRNEIISLGGTVLFEHTINALTVRQGELAAIRTSKTAEIACQALALCIGHSARDTVEMLHEMDVVMQPKAFSVGVRIEHLQSEIDQSLYGDLAGHPALPRGEYQLSHRHGGRGVYTFCMCPGGFVVPAASEEGMVVTNGMSEYARNAVNANAALVVGVEPGDYQGGVLGGIAFQRRLEQAAFVAGGRAYKAPAQTVGRFLTGKAGIELGKVNPSYALGVTGAQFAELFPPFVLDMLKLGLINFSTKMRAFAYPEAVMTGVETRTSSPVRIVRDDSLQSDTVRGLYPCGEGAGYAGGIISAAVDGLRVAQAIMQKHGPPA